MNLKKLFLTIIFLQLLLGTVSLAYSSDIPSSKRSRKAVERVTPSLKEELGHHQLKLGLPVFMRILKAPNKLEIYLEKDKRFVHFKTYPICNFSGELGPKVAQGDLQSPEGFYFVRPIQLNPSSKFHLSFNLGYPNKYDRAHGRTGSALMVHGNCVSIGCYAMTDAAIEEIYTLVDAAFRGGQTLFRVHIFPFEMSDSNLKHHSSSPWAGFWSNLKTGYDYFEQTAQPPDVTVKDKQYVFGPS